MIVERGCFCYSIVNDIRNFVFGLAGATVYGFCKSREQKFVMSFTIILERVMRYVVGQAGRLTHRRTAVQEVQLSLSGRRAAVQQR